MAVPLCVLGCQDASPIPSAQGKPSLTASPKSARYIALGELRAHDRIITISSGPTGPAYTIKSKDGAILATHLSKEELLARFPELNDAVAEGLTANLDHPNSPDEPMILAPTQRYDSHGTMEPMTLTPPH